MLISDVFLTDLMMSQLLIRGGYTFHQLITCLLFLQLLLSVFKVHIESEYVCRVVEALEHSFVNYSSEISEFDGQKGLDLL